MIVVKGNVDPRAVEQLQACVDNGDALGGAICADGHVGYSMPIGGVVAYREMISPSGVGYDIGCGNMAVRTNVKATHILVSKVMDEIERRISFGVGRINNEPVDHPVLDEIRVANFEPQRQLIQMAAQQLGTVGSGNHYVDLFEDEDGYVWIGVHFGSRGFGHKTASGFLAMAQGLGFDGHGIEGEMMSPPILFSTQAYLGQAYIEAMELAGKYAYAGREVVVDKVLDILGAEANYTVHNHHNFAWLEEHQGEKVWVVRKGATPAFPGQEGFVGATMGESSVILEGAPASAEAEELFFSTVHGAGRVMSRTQAAGKIKRTKYWTCRMCGEHFDQFPLKGQCNECLNPVDKHFSTKQVKAGLINWKAALKDLGEKGIELRGGAADEAPDAYKRLDEVLEAHGDTIHVTYNLRPIGVAMAGKGIHDPFKD